VGRASNLQAMAFVKILKNSAFFKRYQVPKRRRRQGKTDYQARRKMVRQDKNKFNNRKYRFVVRFTNTKVICQVVYSTIAGDRTVVQAISTELDKFGIKSGYKNYAAAYATGLLVARRALQHFGMDSDFKGKETIDGEEYHVEEEEEGERRPFKCILDVGLRRTCVGARMWGALKGAADGGLHVPHNTKNFPGHKSADEKGGDDDYDAEVHKAKIFGNHVSEYMAMLEEEDATKYEAHFAKFIKHGIKPDGVEKMYEDAHSKIRANPKVEKKVKKAITMTRKGNWVHPSEGKEYKRSIKLTLRQRRQKVDDKIKAAQQRALEE
jgi:large subunit ribosomal protein L5e